METVTFLVDDIIFNYRGKHLSTIESTILQQVLLGEKYVDIAEEFGYTEGHIKDVAYQLWKLFSEVLNEKVTKSNFKSVLERHLKSEAVTSNFMGREEAIAHLNTLVNRGDKIIVIQGEGGIGKTTLAQYYLQQQFEVILEVLMAKETRNILSVETIVEEWLRKDFNEEPGREFGVTLGRLKRHLKNAKTGILIDNLEPALDGNGKLLHSLQNYRELLRILGDSQVKSVTLITSRDRLCESDINITHFRLPGLALGTWQKFFQNQQIIFEQLIVQDLHKIYGGNAKAMNIISGIVQEDFAGNLNAYRQETQDDLLVDLSLKNLVVEQFNRLQSIDPEAYKLLCRLGCYRYQNISKLTKIELKTVLWDVDCNKHSQILSSLCNRSLIESLQGKYWLHPVIRAEALSRLKLSQEWQVTNSKIAEFWTNSVEKILVIEDGLKALEAYYHYVEIEEFALAAKVILKSRDNQWGQYLPLGSTLYRLGFIQPVLLAIRQIIDKISSETDRSELYNILGDLFWITGHIHQAIAYQQKTIDIARSLLDKSEQQSIDKHTLYYLKMLEVDALLSTGLYKIDLWELQEASTILQQVISLTNNTAHYRWGQKASICLALINSYLAKEEATSLANVNYHDTIAHQLTGRFAFFIQILGQTFVNLKDFARASELYQKALTFSEESNYSQIQGRILTGLAEIERYQNNYTGALTKHQQSIVILERIGAKCDLAEAYFQRGLTYQKLADISQANVNFEKAIQLFSQMQAPKQVQKVYLYQK